MIKNDMYELHIHIGDKLILYERLYSFYISASDPRLKNITLSS